MFDSYRARLGYHGSSDRDAMKSHREMIKEAVFSETQSYREVIINGKRYDARITTDVNDTLKTGNGNMSIEFRDRILFKPGTYIQIKNAFGEYEPWLLMDLLDDMIIPRGLIKKCPYELRWKNSKGNIISRWITFDDSYKLYDAVRNYGYKTNLPESTLTINLPLDRDTAEISLDKRFIVDIDNAEIPNVYSVSARNAVSGKYSDDSGIIKLSLSQDQFNHETDSKELMIADYYTETDTSFVDPGKEFGVNTVNISYKGQCRIVMGTPYKEFVLHFCDKAGNEIEEEVGEWKILFLPELESFFTYEVDGNRLKIKSEYNENILNYTFKIIGSNKDGSISDSLSVKVVSGI